MLKQHNGARCWVIPRQQFSKFGYLCTDLALTYLPRYARSGRCTLRANLWCKLTSNLKNQRAENFTRCLGKNGVGYRLRGQYVVVGQAVPDKASPEAYVVIFPPCGGSTA